MKRDEIKELMLGAGFTLDKEGILSYPGSRGLEDVYTKRPKYKYTFRVSLVDKSSSDYGLYVGRGSQFRLIDNIVPHDIDVSGVWKSDKPLPMWTGDNLKDVIAAI